MSRPSRNSRLVRAFSVSAVALSFASVQASAGAAEPPANDLPSGASAFEVVTAENGPVLGLQSVLDLQSATPEPQIARCLGPTSFERTAWLAIEPSPTARRITIEATPKDLSTNIPDLALYVQRQPPVIPKLAQLCSGRETSVDPRRGDDVASATAVLAAGRRLLVQVGWRASDPNEPVVATLSSVELQGFAASVRGAEPRRAPKLAIGKARAVPLRGARISSADPAQPRCQTQAAVWRRLSIKKRGYYVVAAAGNNVASLTSFSGVPKRDNATACAATSLAQRPELVIKASRQGTHWLRIGTDRPELAQGSALAVTGPYKTRSLARKAQARTRKLATKGL